MTAEEVLVQLARLGLRGDVSSMRRYLRRVLRGGSGASLTDTSREQLAALLTEEAATNAVMRDVQDIRNKNDDGASLVTVDAPSLDEPPPLLPAESAAEIDQIIREHERAHELEAADLVPTRTLLLTGAPGVGKSMTARSVAARLGLPLLRADLSALMSSYLGKTGQNLRSALLQARSEPTVMLLDEFDAIAKRRDDPSDVGELKRIVNVLLVELEEWPASSLLIAATNHPELLDRAIWRRFERVVSIGLPTADIRDALLKRHVARHGQAIGPETARAFVAATAGFSGADVTTLVRVAVRRVVLDRDGDLDTVLLEEALERLRVRAQTDDAEARATYCKISHDLLGASHRDIGAKLGLSHVTIGNILRAPSAHGRRSARVSKSSRPSRKEQRP